MEKLHGTGPARDPDGFQPAAMLPKLAEPQPTTAFSIGQSPGVHQARHGPVPPEFTAMSLFKNDAVLSFLAGFGITATALLATIAAV